MWKKHIVVCVLTCLGLLFVLPQAQAGVGYVRVQYLGQQKAKIEAYACALLGAGAGFTNQIDARQTKEFNGAGVQDFVINDGCGGKWTKARVSVWVGGTNGRYFVVQDNIQFEGRDANAGVFITGPFQDGRPPAQNWFSPYDSARLAQGRLADGIVRTKQVRIYNRTTSKASCVTPVECGKAGPNLWVDSHNCDAVQRSQMVAGRSGVITIDATDKCGQWAQLYIYADYFGVRNLCARSIDSATETAIYVYGPYERGWSDSAGVFECKTTDAAGSTPLVKNGGVQVHNVSTFETWVGYAPSGCNRGANWLAIAPQGAIHVGANGYLGPFYSIYNHDCKQYSAFWMVYNNDSSWCSPRGIKGNNEFIHYGGYVPGWCEVHGKSLDGF